MKPKVEVREQVKAFLDRLAPEPRRRIKWALKALPDQRGNVMGLRESLSGYHRLRVGGYRVIFRYLAGGVIECVYAEERSLVYKLFEREMLERLRHESSTGSTETDPLVEEAQVKYRSKKPKKKRRSKLPG